MTSSGPSISIVHSDPSWATIGASAARSNRPDFAELLRQQTKYRPGLEFKRAGTQAISTKISSIHAGLAETEIQPVVKPKSTNQDAIDFDAPVGMVADIKAKAELLPIRDVFMPIVSGVGLVDSAAVESWRIDVACTTSELGTTLRTLDRGISR